MSFKRTILVSAEFTSFVGRGACDAAALPYDPVILGFGDIGEPAVSVLAIDEIGEDAGDDLVVFAIGRAACARLFGIIPKAQGSWYLPADLRGLGRAIVAVEGDGEAQDMLRAARSVELLHRLFATFGDDRMVEVQGATTLSETDVLLIATAHQIVQENWQQPLTVSSVARRCGLNKSKLTRGFRDLYRCTVPEAVSERRLGRAREMLAESDLPVSTVGYRCGYASNASFTRAFARRFGMTPTDLRRKQQIA
jgi:AraC family transcriptional activator of pyochelin receptor